MEEGMRDSSDYDEEVAREGSMSRFSENRKKRALAMAQARKRIQLRLRTVDEKYGNTHPFFKLLRKVVLFAVYGITLFDVWFALVILVSAVAGFEWLGLKVCTCKYRCNDAWHQKYTANDWNVTFSPGVCGPEIEQWNCQVQSTWSTCVCNQIGTTAASGNLLLNVADCNFFEITGAYLFLDLLIVVFGLVQSSSMFKLAQFSPDTDPVNFNKIMCFFAPKCLQNLFNARPQESKASFAQFFLVLIICWQLEVLCLVYILATGEYFGESSYELPDKFLRYQNASYYLHILTLIVQAVALHLWRLGVEAHFRVTPRLKLIKLKQEKGGKQVVIYNCETDHQMRGKHPAGSGGSHTEKPEPHHGGGGGGGNTHRKTSSPKEMIKTMHENPSMVIDKMKDQVDDAVNVFKGAFGSLLDKVSGGGGHHGSEGTEITVADPLYLNVVTGLVPNDPNDEEECFDFKFRLDYVDKIGLVTSPPPLLAIPLVTLFVLPGEKEHATERKCVACKTVSKSWLAACVGTYSNITYELKLERNLVLGRHRLDIRQPLASSATISHIESRNWLGFKTSQQKKGNNHHLELSVSSSIDERGRSTGGSDASDRIDEEEGEEYDQMLDNCNYHEVTDITFMDPEFDRRKLQQLSSRLDMVEQKVEEFGPKLESMFAKYGEEQAESEEKKFIHSEGCLHDYYVLLQMRIVGTATACSAIASGMVGDESEAGGTATTLIKGGAALQFLGDNCGLPFAGMATALIAGVAYAVEEHQKAKRVRCLEEIFYTPARADVIAEAVARTVVRRLVEELRELDEEDKRKLSKEKSKKRTRVGAMVKMAKDLASMAEVAYADNEVKKKAEDDATTILENIMTGRLSKTLSSMNGEEGKNAVVDDVTLVEILSSYIALPIEGEEPMKLEEMKVSAEPSPPPPSSSTVAVTSSAELPPVTNSTTNNTVASPTNHHHSRDDKDGEMDWSNRSNSYSFEIDSMSEALRYLQEGVEFTKTTYFGNYRYSLWLNATTPRLEWQQLGSLTKSNVTTRHSLVLDSSVHFVTPKASTKKGKNLEKERKLYLRSSSVPQDTVFEFPRAEAASQFKKCLEIVLTQFQPGDQTVYGNLKSPLLSNF